MATIKLMHAKVHQARVSEANRHYVGSVTIDQDLLKQVGILPYGGGTLLCQAGDTLIIWANEERDRSEVLQYGHEAQVKSRLPILYPPATGQLFVNAKCENSSRT